MSSSIPIKLLHEAAGFEITVQLVTGDKYQGILSVIEDNMNCWLNDVVHTATNGDIEQVQSAYLRGSSILYINVPEMFSNSHLFQSKDTDSIPSKYSGKLKRGYTKAKKQEKDAFVDNFFATDESNNKNHS